MRVEIDGKVYDTEKAKCRFYYDGTLDFAEEFVYAAETLYETEIGEHFLFCECEPRWKFLDKSKRRELGKMKRQIFPLTDDEVAEWLDGKDCICL